nr:PIN domain-containing protein [Jiella mangrovi]
MLDTNVLSEAMKPNPDSNVLAWLNQQSPSTLWLTTITVAELRFGVAKLPEGKRHAALENLVESYIALFFGRIASFDMPATVAFAAHAAGAARRGREVKGFADAAIAAIAVSNGFSVATRDIRPFVDMGVQVINPWLPAETPRA